jgi:hypothetical protein
MRKITPTGHDIDLQPGTLAAALQASSILHSTRRHPDVITIDPPPASFERPGHYAKLLIEGEILMKDFSQMLYDNGYEMYPDCAGNTVIRTIESGNKHRAKVSFKQAYTYGPDPDEEHSDD